MKIGKGKLSYRLIAIILFTLIPLSLYVIFSDELRIRKLFIKNITEPTYSGPLRNFKTSFESISDFDTFYIVPPGEFASSHSLSSENAYDGKSSHKSWITSSRDDTNDGMVYKPHRAYPTIQFQKTEGGIFRTPALITLYVNADMELKERKGIDDWLSLATLTPDASDEWARTVLVNVTPDNYLRLVHVPRQGQQEYIYQASGQNDPEGKLRFPYKQWVRLDILIDFDEHAGYAKVWQNGTLISHANVEGGLGGLAQAHFGMYASAAISSGTVYNDKLSIREVENEASAIEIIRAER